MPGANQRLILVNEGDTTKASISTKGTKGAVAVEVLDESGENVGVVIPTTPYSYNKAITLANTEYSQALPTGTKKLDIKLRSYNTSMKISFVSGESGTTYTSLAYGQTYHLENVNLIGVTIYFQSTSASQVAEIIAWT